MVPEEEKFEEPKEGAHEEEEALGFDAETESGEADEGIYEEEGDNETS